MISEWRRQSKSAGLWQYQTFRHGLRDARYALYILLLFFSTYYGLLGRATCGVVRLEWQTDWIDCECLLFTPCSWLRRRNVKKIIIGSLCCIVSSASWLTRSRSVTASTGSNTKPGIVKPVALFHHSHRIVDSSRQSSPGISPKDCFNYGKFSIV